LVYNIIFKKSVERDLKNLAKAEAARILRRIERELSRKPESCPVLKGQFAGLRKYRIGEYRVIYAVTGKDVLILRIGHRREVYKHKI
jgi:mRNA interferase RelE/StbE